MAAKIERIYIGGLDPSRGLNVELVSSRLCSVEGVEILSINDVAITTATDAKKNKKQQQQIMYNPTNAIVDQDGDFVDTRNFFYIEARSASSSVENAPKEKEEEDDKPSIPQPQPSAFDLLAKQYNSVKWKGCQLRVEAAKPHFLKRLEGERAVRLEKQRMMEQADEEARKLMQIGDADADDGADALKKDADGEEEPTTTTTPKQPRRRLRIRKRFGEEAYHVDTLPHPLSLHSQKEDAFGWEEFAHLNKKLKRKRSSQQQKLVERRKKERRLWASGKGTGKVPPKMEDGGGNGDDQLNALIFLNRGIHVRFSDENVVAAVERGSDVVPPLQEGESLEVGDGDALVETDVGVVEDYASATSSSVVSSSDDSEDSSESEVDTKERSKKTAYAWSDDEDDQGEVSSEESVGSMGDANNQGTKKETYSWSDDDDGVADSKVQADGSDDRSTGSEDSAKVNPKEAKRLMVGSSSAAYTKAAAMDEFSGGMDFGNNDDPDTFVEWRDASDSGIDDGDDDGAGSDEDETEYIAEDDIKSNMGILSKMFPGERFGQGTAVASIADKKGKDNSEDGDNKPTAANELGKRQNTSSMFGAGLIMQRYDPLKEADKKFEVAQASKATEKAEEETSTPVEEGMDKDEGEDKEEDESLEEDASASSESSDDEDEASKDHDKDPEEHSSESSEESKEEKPTTDTNDKKTKAPSNLEGKDVPAKAVYEQDKLEQVFKQARGGQSESFSLASLLDKKEEQAAERGDVYEQDKLENVFKQARGADGSSTNASAGGGFSFGFQSQPQTDDKAGDGFSFGFDLGNAPKVEGKECAAAAVEQGQENHLDAGESATNQSSVDMVNKTTSEPKKAANQRKRRVGMMAFPESDLDKYENMFFSLNEGTQILKDLNAMKQDEENQEKWQKERLALTADWKRKQKSASSRKPKKARR